MDDERLEKLSKMNEILAENYDILFNELQDLKYGVHNQEVAQETV